MPFLPAALVVFALMDPGQAPAQRTILRAVQVSSEAGAAEVVIQSEGPLPPPLVGVVDDPPRIYLDFEGVTPATRGTSGGTDPLVRRVRVAVYQPRPLVTRVVIDLRSPARHEVDVTRRQFGELTVIVGSTQTATPRPAKAPAQRNLRAAAERERAATMAALEELERLRPLLMSIDTRASLADDTLRAGSAQFETVRLTLATLGPPDAVTPTQELLMTVCMLGKRAADTRLDSTQRADDTRAWNAASAAAGALILLDRAARELRSLPVPE